MTTRKGNAMTAKKKPCSSDLQRGINAASSELQRAEEEYARAAYAHATDRDDEKARKEVLTTRQRIDLLRAEIDGLQAAHGEASKREAADAVEEAHRDRMSAFDDAAEQAASIPALFAECAAAMALLGQRRTELLSAIRGAQSLIKRGCANATRMPEMMPFNERKLELYWQGLLQHHRVVHSLTFGLADSQAAQAKESAEFEATRLETFGEEMRRRVVARRSAA
jgi:hypothetical protein